MRYGKLGIQNPSYLSAERKNKRYFLFIFPYYAISDYFDRLLYIKCEWMLYCQNNLRQYNSQVAFEEAARASAGVLLGQAGYVSSRRFWTATAAKNASLRSD
jgi:hypothetical protein